MTGTGKFRPSTCKARLTVPDKLRMSTEIKKQAALALPQLSAHQCKNSTSMRLISATAVKKTMIMTKISAPCCICNLKMVNRFHYKPYQPPWQQKKAQSPMLPFQT
jgi:hypothetical protein